MTASFPFFSFLISSQGSGNIIRQRRCGSPTVLSHCKCGYLPPGVKEDKSSAAWQRAREYAWIQALIDACKQNMHYTRWLKQKREVERHSRLFCFGSGECWGKIIRLLHLIETPKNWITVNHFRFSCVRPFYFAAKETATLKGMSLLSRSLLSFLSSLFSHIRLILVSGW